VSWLRASPQTLAAGLVLRTATPADIEPLVTFNGAVHTYSPDGAPSPRIMARVREWLDGSHPLIGPGDFLVVEETATRSIISSVAVLRQQWTYAGIPFEVAQTEFVGTTLAFRRHGLVRRLMAVVHAASAAAGHLMQIINGIPWYYRQFGYEQTLPMQGGRGMRTSQVPAFARGSGEPCTIRPATPADLPFIMAVERQAQQRSLYAVQRAPAYWHHELFGLHELNIFRRQWSILQTPSGESVGYLAHVPRPAQASRWLSTLEIAAGRSWWEVVSVALRYLRDLPGEVPAETVGIAGGDAHPAYDIFPTTMSLRDLPHVWYVRIPDAAAFLHHIAPALERRLAASVAQGYTGELRLNTYRTGVLMRFERGRLATVTPWAEADARAVSVASAAFPETAWMHLLCGTRSLAELEVQVPDCQVDGDATRMVLNALFPVQPSLVRSLA
jgi:hypothetical protein